MRKNKIHILSTGPLAEDLRREAAQYEIAVDTIAFIRTQYITDKVTQRDLMDLCGQTLTGVFTSAHAVSAVAAMNTQPVGWQIYCIGGGTLETVRQLLPMVQIVATAPDGVALSRRICENTSLKEITFFCGDRRRDELPVILQKNGIAVREITVYRTIAAPLALTKNYDAILFFSPSGVQSFYAANPADPNTQLFAIGSTTAAEIKKHTEQPVIIASSPRKEDLLRMAITHFSKTKMI